MRRRFRSRVAGQTLDECEYAQREDYSTSDGPNERLIQSGRSDSRGVTVEVNIQVKAPYECECSETDEHSRTDQVTANRYPSNDFR